MRRRVYLTIIMALLVAVVILYSAAGDDTIALVCSTGTGTGDCPTGSNGVLLLAKGKGILPAIANTTSNVTFSGGIHSDYEQVMAFRGGYKPAYEKKAWTGASETLTLKFEPSHPLNIRIWVICPDTRGACTKPLTANRETYLKNFVTNANTVLDSERVGINLIPAGGTLISDSASTRAGAPEFGNFDSEKCPDLVDWALEDPGNRSLPNAVNIYVVSRVDGLTSNGYNCSRGPLKLSVTGATARWTTILHEVGHTLTLEDLPRDDVGWTGKQKENFMRSYSSTRKYFTEAQIFRIWVNDLSAVVAIDPPQRSCGLTDTEAGTERPPCPKLQERVWSEP